MGFFNWLFGKRGDGTTAQSQPAVIPRISGPDKFAFEVMGESYYLKSFERLFGPRQARGIDEERTAHLVLDDANPHDNQAVRVEIEGHQVGHLSRADARQFRAAVIAGGLIQYRRFSCAAAIRGGWDNGDGDKGHYGVRLDLPTS